MRESARAIVPFGHRAFGTTVTIEAACGFLEFPSCFDQIDLDSGGTLDSSELQQAFVAMGETIGMEDLEKVIAEVWMDGPVRTCST